MLRFNPTITQKIYATIAFGGFALTGIVGLSEYSAFSSSNKFQNFNNRQISLILQVQNLRQSVTILENIVVSHPSLSEEISQEEFDAEFELYRNQSRRELLNLRQNPDFNDPELKKILDKLHIRFEGFLTISQNVINDYRNNQDVDDLTTDIKGLHQVSNKIDTELDHLGRYAKDSIEKESLLLSHELEMQRYIFGSLIGVIFFVIGSSILYLRSKVINPMQQFFSAIAEFGKPTANLSTRLLLTSNDEFSESIRYFNTFLDRVEELDNAVKNYVDTLEKRVNEEVLKNREKDAILAHQSRFVAMGELMSSIAHQWRQPLNILGLVIQDIEDAYQHNELNDAYMAKQIQKGMRNLEYLSHTIDNFRTLFRQKEDEIFDVRTQVEKACDLVEHAFGEQGIYLLLLLETEDACLVHGSSEMVVQIILSLISNAKDAILTHNISHGKTTLTVSKDENYVSITCSDNGGGVSNDVVEKMFDPYFTTKHQAVGTGLGLYIAKSIIDNMNGSITYHFNGEGSDFIMKLPLYKGI